jgi:hypothetical protein
MASITISSANVAGWQGNSTGVQLRIYTNSSFTASSGNLYPQTMGNPASLGSFYQVYSCSVSGSTLTLPPVHLDSTTDSIDNPSATFSAVLWDSVSGKPIQVFGTESTFALAPSPTTTSWGNVFAADLDDID